MDSDKKDEALRKFEDGLEELSKLLPEDRIDIYERLFGKEGRASRDVQVFGRQQAIFNRGAFNEFRRDRVEISNDGFVIPRKPRVFLSHSHADKKLARSIYSGLERAGIYVWFDEAELRFGDSLIGKLREAIDQVDILLALISANSINSEWVKREVEIAMNQEIGTRRIKVIPLLCDRVELPGFLIGKLYADFQTPALIRKNLTKLASDIKLHLQDVAG